MGCPHALQYIPRTSCCRRIRRRCASGSGQGAEKRVAKKRAAKELSAKKLSAVRLSAVRLLAVRRSAMRRSALNRSARNPVSFRSLRRQDNLVNGGQIGLPGNCGERMSWVRREDNKIESGANRVRTEGLWSKCEGWGQTIWKAELEANLQVCPKCGRHERIGARARIESLLEPGFEFVDGELRSTDPLEFTDLKPYKGRLANARRELELNDAVVNAQG